MNNTRLHVQLRRPNLNENNIQHFSNLAEALQRVHELEIMLYKDNCFFAPIYSNNLTINNIEKIKQDDSYSEIIIFSTNHEILVKRYTSVLLQKSFEWVKDINRIQQ